MKNRLCLTCSERIGNRWLPIPIGELGVIINRKISAFITTDSNYQRHKNLCYNLQYLQFLDQCLEQLYLTSVLEIMVRKNFIVTSFGIIEAILEYEVGKINSKIRSFDQIVEIAKNNKILGKDSHLYKLVMKIKPLRNKTHLGSREDQSTDYQAFDIEQLHLSKNILLAILKQYFSLSNSEIIGLFSFLQTKEQKNGVSKFLD